jgi:YidC/Oxa1 family membrane protein insertase
MQTTMPLMFGFFSLSFPSGLSIYFVLSNLIGMAQGYYMRYLTNKEKAEAAANKGKQPVVVEAMPSSEPIGNDSSEVALQTASDPTPTAPPPAKKKSQSKRKRRSG